MDFRARRAGVANRTFVVSCSRERRSVIVSFFQPVWLLLLVPLAVAWWVWPLPSRWLRMMRAVTMILIVFALAQFAIRLPDRSGTVIVVADRSESMPNKADTSQKEIIDLLHK